MTAIESTLAAIRAGGLFPDLEFDEELHRYYHNGQRLRGTTGTIEKRYVPPFDPDGTILARCAMKRGVKAEVIRKEWDAAKDLGASRGTHCHGIAENILLGRPYATRHPEAYAGHARSTIAAANWLLGQDRWEVVAVEIRMYWLPGMLAGTSDLVIWDRVDRILEIWDWKTSKSIDKTNDWGDRMLGCLSHLPKCSGVEYGIQLGLYREMLARRLRELGYVFPDRIRSRVLWLRPEGVFDQESDLIQLPVYRDEVEEILEELRDEIRSGKIIS